MIGCQSPLTAHALQRSEATPGFDFEVPASSATSTGPHTLIALLFVSLLNWLLWTLPNAQAVSPAPDGGYPGEHCRAFVHSKCSPSSSEIDFGRSLRRLCSRCPPHPPSRSLNPVGWDSESQAVFQELGSVVTVEPKWSLEGVFPSRAVFKVAARHETRREWADLF